MTDVHIIGAAMTPFGKFPDSTVRSLAEAATRDALADCGLGADAVEMVIFGNAAAGVLTEQEMIRGQVALRHTGLLGRPIVNVENACASASTALHLAWAAVRGGAVEVAIAVGAEKLTHPEKARSFAAIGGAVDQFELAEMKARIKAGGNTSGDDSEDSQRSFFMDIYAARARSYMELSGATVEDFANVAVKSHHFASLNPNAQYRNILTTEEVLASREISWPLNLLMCSPIGDGAAAVVVCSDKFRRKLDTIQSVRVRASVLQSGRDRAPDEESVVKRTADLAYEQADLGPEDLHVVELHDAAAPAELIDYEELGLCEKGGGADLLRSGATSLGGRLPVNTSGGLLSRGHPIGATGCAQIVELVDQLRGRCGDRQVPGARVALAQNGGGSLGEHGDAAAMAVTVLEA